MKSTTPKNKKPKTKHSKLIAEIDKTILILRDGWIDANAKAKKKWIDKIDGELDNRLKLMSSWDG